MLTKRIETTGQAVKAIAECAWSEDGLQVINVSLVDSKGRFVPDACLTDGLRLLGAGNGDPAFRGQERPAPGTAPESFTIPAFNGHAQFIILNPDSAPVRVTL